ncbi:lasso peptide biosynthesis B2 protein [Paenibacillus aurantius]
MEACFYLALARILILLPFSRVAPILGVIQEETSRELTGEKKVLSPVHDAILLMSRHTFWDSRCLVKAIAALKMLERRGLESTLYLGVGRDDQGKMAAHAWLRCGPYYITGYESMDNYVVVGKFAKVIDK